MFNPQIVSRQSVLKMPDDQESQINIAIELVNEILTANELKLPTWIAEDIVGSYGPVQTEVLRRIREAGWMVSYNIEQRAFLIS